MSFYNQVLEFISQANTSNLKTKHYTSKYLDTQVKVSFGQGNTARIPWISFLIEPHNTSNGIYPVYLFYKEHSILVLAYGLSETVKPEKSWNLENKNTIKEYFELNGLKKPDRYGESYVYKVYQIEDLPDRSILDKDLNQIIQTYKNLTSQMTNETVLDFNIKSLQPALKEAGLAYSNKLITRFTASLLTKPFLILTGLSGSGKTKLAQAFAKWICYDEKQYCIVPVGADWTNREPLLGYPNALDPNKYVRPDSGVLSLILEAIKKPELPYILILDEMNLSHVERYFADFLSAMESKEGIRLQAEERDNVPATVCLPSNLFVIGTVNIDETTHMFSPKVLDRANTIEFRISKDEMGRFLAEPSVVDLKELECQGAMMGSSFITMAQSRNTSNEDGKEIKTILIRFFNELKKTGAEFGYRTASEILRLVHHLSDLDSSLTIEKKIDIAIIQKLLPKLHGSGRKLTPVLKKLASFCVIGDEPLAKDALKNVNFDFQSSGVKYPLSLEKIIRMHRAAIDNGFASFAEA